jgi:hypothetical protein
MLKINQVWGRALVISINLAGREGDERKPAAGWL